MKTLTFALSITASLFTCSTFASLSGDKNPYPNPAASPGKNEAFEVGYKQAILEPCKDSEKLGAVAKAQPSEVANWLNWLDTQYHPDHDKYRKDLIVSAYEHGISVGELNPINCETAEPLQAKLPSVDFHGVWEGLGKQGNDSWKIIITLTDKGYSIDYPSLNCGGKLEAITSYNNNALFREKITYGQTQCVDNGKTMLTRTDESILKFKWYYPDGKLGATGTLNK